MCIPAIGLVGGLVSAASSLAGASAQSSQLKAQAKFADRQAAVERQRGSVEAARQRQTGEALFGRGVAGFARAGVSLSGSPTAVLSNIRAENELDTDRIRLNSRAREDQQRFNAGLSRSRASAARTRGVFGAISPLISAFSSFAPTGLTPGASR